jgi:hypothetical protein
MKSAQKLEILPPFQGLEFILNVTPGGTTFALGYIFRSDGALIC